MNFTGKTIASESGHWYRRDDGSPAYTVIGANGKERPTTLRDARKLNLVPSVTTILRCAAAPGLERWKQTNLLLASLTLPKRDDESLDEYAERVIQDAAEQSKKAMQLGTDIHTAIEHSFAGKSSDLYAEHVSATRKLLDETFPGEAWTSERSFAHPDGYGGKIDLSSSNVIVDFKTKEFDEDWKVTGYDEHRMQLAAYAKGMGLPANYRAANLFVSTKSPGLVRLLEWSREDLDSAWLMFQHLLGFWKIKNGVM